MKTLVLATLAIAAASLSPASAQPRLNASGGYAGGCIGGILKICDGNIMGIMPQQVKRPIVQMRVLPIRPVQCAMVRVGPNLFRRACRIL